MKFFALSFEESAKSCYQDLPDKGIKDWDQFHEAFNKIWTIKKEGRLSID